MQKKYYKGIVKITYDLIVEGFSEESDIKYSLIRWARRYPQRKVESGLRIDSFAEADPPKLVKPIFW